MKTPFLLPALFLFPITAFAGTSQHAIINGEAIDGDEFESAAALILQTEIDGLGPITQVSCTATLIAPDVVLTAGHCVDEYPITFGFFELDELTFCVSFEADLSAMVDPAANGNPDLPDDAVCSSGFVQHPDFSFEDLSGEVDGLVEFDDIALVFLEEEIHDRAFSYLPDAAEAEAIVVDLEVDIVGYGQRDAEPQDPFGDPQEPLRYWAHTVVNEVAPTEMQIGDGPETGRKCHGDSGGPSFAEIGLRGATFERVIGVTSHAYSAQEDCNRGGADTRVDAYLDWIEDAMIAACDDGLRSWCDEPGIPDPGEAIGDDDDDDGGDGCQDCSSEIAGGEAPLSVLALVALLGLRRRR